MLVRINKENEIYFESLWLTDAKTINAWIKNKFDNMMEKDTMLTENYNVMHNIDKKVDWIIDAIKAKAEKPKSVITASVQVNEKIKKPLSEKQAVYYNDKFNTYKKYFEQTKSRGTDSKLIDSLYVFEPWNNELNHQLHIDLGMLVLEKDVDWTEYMDQQFYNYLN